MNHIQKTQEDLKQAKKRLLQLRGQVNSAQVILDREKSAYAQAIRDYQSLDKELSEVDGRVVDVPRKTKSNVPARTKAPRTAPRKLLDAIAAMPQEQQDLIIRTYLKSGGR